MHSRIEGYAEGLLTTVSGLVLLLSESIDLVTRVAGSLAVCLGLFYATVRFLWDYQDRIERKRARALPRPPTIFNPEPLDPL